MHHSTNARVLTTAKPKAAASRRHFCQGAHLRTKQRRACCAQLPEGSFDESSIGDSAVIVSRDQESELMSSLKAPCKKPLCLQSVETDCLEIFAKCWKPFW